MSAGQPLVITDPLVIMFREPDGNVITHLHQADLTHEQYGLLVCDLVRHVAKAFQVDEGAVWAWVERERDRPTTELRSPS